MWIDRATYNTLDNLITTSQDQRTQKMIENSALMQKVTDLERMNARLSSDLDWFKHRVSQLERERGQMMLDRLGLAVPVPQFVPASQDPAEAFNQIPSFDTVGNDAKDEDTTEDFAANLGQELAVSYDMLPRRK